MRKRRPTHPGELLREEVLKPLNLTITEAARRLDISRKNLSALLNEKISLSSNMAVRIALATGTSPMSWLEMQVKLDIWRAQGKTFHIIRFQNQDDDSDIHITDNEGLVNQIYSRKQDTYFVNKVYPVFSVSDLRHDLIDRARKMTRARTQNHPWQNMTDEEILRSAGLILTDTSSGREGITLAAILLFGPDNLIMSALAHHKTDAIFRVFNTDRYDDRDVIITNLLESHDHLIAFGKKHLNDLFVMEGLQSISARDKILCEIVSNSLAHRDYSNAYVAKFVIEKDCIFTENGNRSHGFGKLDHASFQPFPKNPPISKVFREIGLADELGSGMRNTYKYTKLYSGAEPIFSEGEVFRIVVPLYNDFTSSNTI
ncbi:MAG: HigA family addiction module antitoxin [Sphaerochaeta sp.]|nr:HigA family addiction module antitoxin [Sphaerochaeta sp.]